MCEVSPIKSKLDASNSSQNQAQSSAESGSGKQNVSAESNSQPSQFSVQEVGRDPDKLGHETQAQDQIVSPKTNNINDLKNADLSNKKKEEIQQPLVKPFPSQPTNTKPLEFPAKTAEHSSVKPPWAKTQNNDSPKPSINNLPKLVPQSSIEPQPSKESVERNSSAHLTLSEPSNGNDDALLTPAKLPPLVVPFPGKVLAQDLQDPPLSPVHKSVSFQQQPDIEQHIESQSEVEPSARDQTEIHSKVEAVKSGDSLPVVEPVRSGDSLPKPQPLSPVKPVETQQSFQFPSNSSKPLEVPPSQSSSDATKQESPKLILNNIPKPFKAEAEKSGESIEGSPEVQPAINNTENSPAFRK